MKASSVHAAILELLNNEPHTHLSALEIYENIRCRLPAVAPSTVYRALDRMAKAGDISVSDMGTGAAVYEAVNGGIHHHLICHECGMVMTIDHQEVDNFFHAIQSTHTFTIATNHLILFGLCAHCREKQS